MTAENISVLIVDDSFLARQQLRDYFVDKMGFKIAGEGENGEEAVTLYQDLKPDFISLDMNMPLEGGLYAIKKIMDQDPQAVILIVSAIRNGDRMTEAMKLGPKGYIKKPLDFFNAEFVQDFNEELKHIINAVKHKKGSP